jgi:glycosyltransferase involved in cell wall biosynthesis
MPLFSIVIPTRNRADLLRYAIKSVLQQDCDDYELVISDNDSSDDTHRTALQFNSRKIRYVNTGKYLLANDSWNFAYTQAAGDYILLLSDDDYLVPSVLRQVKKVIQQTSALIVSSGWVFYRDATHNAAERNTIVTRKFTNRILKMSTKEELRKAFAMEYIGGRRALLFHTSCFFISRHIADEISNKYGVFYAPPLGDVTAIHRSFAYTDFLLLIDKPLVVVGSGSRSSAYKFSHSLSDAYDDIQPELSSVIFRGKYLLNLYTEALLEVKHGDPERFKDYDINMEQYCNLYYEWMMNASGAGYDISADLRDFYEKLSTLPPDIQTKVRQYIRKGQEGWVIRLLRESPLYNVAPTRMLMARLYTQYLKTMGKLHTLYLRYLRIRYSNWFSGYDIVSGNRVGVHDIASCANHLAEIAQALKEPADAWDYQRDPTWSE